jgi:hypothetical protein
MSASTSARCAVSVGRSLTECCSVTFVYVQSTTIASFVLFLARRNSRLSGSLVVQSFIRDQL